MRSAVSDQEQIETLKAWAHWRRLELAEYAAKQSTDGAWQNAMDLLGGIEYALARIQELEAENARLKADPKEIQKYWNGLTRIEITTPAPTPEPTEGGE